MNNKETEDCCSQEPLDQSKNNNCATTPGSIEMAPSDEIGNMSKAKAFGIWSAIICGVVCPFLDEGIISTAIPKITDEFGSLADVGVSFKIYFELLRG